MPRAGTANAALEQVIELVDIDSLRPHPRNPRQGDVGAVMLSIATNGWFGTCLVQRVDGRPDTIIGGEHRWKALANLVRGGITFPDDSRATYEELATRVSLPPIGKVPIIPQRWDDALALRVLLADNRTSDLATYDEPELLSILREIAESDAGIMGTGYDGDDVDNLIAQLAGSEGGQPLTGDQDQQEMTTNYGVFVECRDEADQRALLEEFGGRGLNVRAMVR